MCAMVLAKDDPEISGQRSPRSELSSKIVPILLKFEDKIVCHLKGNIV